MFSTPICREMSEPKDHNANMLNSKWVPLWWLKALSTCWQRKYFNFGRERTRYRLAERMGGEWAHFSCQSAFCNLAEKYFNFG